MDQADIILCLLKSHPLFFVVVRRYQIQEISKYVYQGDDGFLKKISCVCLEEGPYKESTCFVWKAICASECCCIRLELLQLSCDHEAKANGIIEKTFSQLLCSWVTESVLSSFLKVASDEKNKSRLVQVIVVIFVTYGL